MAFNGCPGTLRSIKPRCNVKLEQSAAINVVPPEMALCFKQNFVPQQQKDEMVMVYRIPMNS